MFDNPPPPGKRETACCLGLVVSARSVLRQYAMATRWYDNEQKIIQLRYC